MRYRWRNLTITDGGDNTDTLVERDAEQLVDQLKPLGPVGVINGRQLRQLGETAAASITQGQQHSRDISNINREADLTPEYPDRAQLAADD